MGGWPKSSIMRRVFATIAAFDGASVSASSFVASSNAHVATRQQRLGHHRKSKATGAKGRPMRTGRQQAAGIENGFGRRRKAELHAHDDRTKRRGGQMAFLLQGFEKGDITGIEQLDLGLYAR